MCQYLKARVTYNSFEFQVSDFIPHLIFHSEHILGTRFVLSLNKIRRGTYSLDYNDSN
jgi:hypothetical protein